MRTSIVLLCMTKNGRQRVPKLLDSVKGLVDLALFLDTGSEDGTAEFLEEAAYPFPIKVLRSPFVDFATSRNHLFKYANDMTRRTREAKWYLLLDDDHELSQNHPGEFEKLREHLSSNPIYDGVLLRHAGAPEYWVTRIIRGELDWEFRGVTHEYLHPLRTFVKSEGVSIVHKQHFTPAKFERDLKLLSADIARNPNDPRTIFYIAQTLRDKGELDAAARYYTMRATMGGWVEEIYVSMLEAARILKEPALMKKAHAFRPSRAEAAAWLAHYYQAQQKEDLAANWEATRAAIPLSPDILFVHPAAYGPVKESAPKL